MARIDSREALGRLYKAPSERARLKQLDRLDRHCRRFVELSPLAILASASPAGGQDVSPRGGVPGFVRVLDERTLVIPDRPGNNRIDSLANLVACPEVALLFLVPGVDELLRVAGTAEIRDDAELCQSFAVGERRPATVLLVHVREAFLHCGKALMRARLWEADAKVERASLPSMGEMLKEQIGLSAPAESQADMLARYRENLY
ncbi:MAG TPA: pyridoxamine 5'-phosphate oxidase family protein [Alphaproteobacteria bacterium]|nr:pyridoxamine 5'-phosphate oxidase family protein [Alphaproteobacteria bacterium]